MILENLNDAQRSCVTYFDGPLLILAGAGSGKTRVITYKIAYLIEKGVDPARILAVTFTNKAANEMKERVSSLLPNVDVRNMWIGTFHNIALRILRRYYEDVGLKSNFVIYDRDDQFALLKTILKENNIEFVKSDLYTISNGISHAKQKMEPIEEAFGFNKEYNRIAVEYEKRLLEANAVDFDNIIYFTVKILAENKEAKEYYSNFFEYILVDEYQDTNFVQFQFIYKLAGQKQMLCVVGDEDQSIYGWRGANIENIINFEEHFNGAKIMKLEQNYRSTKMILDIANSVIRKNRLRKGKSLWTENSFGTPAVFIEKSTREEEAWAIAMEVKKLRDEGISLNEIALFFRTNAQTREFESVFRKADIPYQIFGALKFYDRREIKDLLSYLKFINNPRDVVSLQRIINLPRRGVGKKSVDTILNLIKNSNMSFYELFEKGMLPNTVVKRVETFYFLLKAVTTLFEDGEMGKAFEKLIEAIDYKNYLKNYFDNYEERWENVLELGNDIVDFEASENSPTLSAYLEKIALIQDIDLWDSNGHEKMNIMTMHKAKGLEFDVVFISGLEEGILPHYNSIGTESELEEERRLFYVAITRARKKVYFSRAREVMNYATRDFQRTAVSRFFKDIPKDYIEFRSGVSQFLKSNSRWGVEISKNTNKSASSQKKSGTKRINAKSGTKVVHEKYGEGTVIATKLRKLVIDFGDGVLKEVDSYDSSLELL